jgi:hypothetical protein
MFAVGDLVRPYESPYALTGRVYLVAPNSMRPREAKKSERLLVLGFERLLNTDVLRVLAHDGVWYIYEGNVTGELV